jgi:glycine dehydrogenase subunit 1
LINATQQAGALAIIVADPMAMGVLEAPGKLGADIVVGEGQSFGNFLSLGGPYLGLFSTKEKFVRQMPGRLVGETVDANGKRGYVLVLATREQHIRREKATSNICTNQGLCALATATYLSLMGPKGLKRLAQTNYSHAVYLREGLSRIKGVKRRFTAPHFNEFVLDLPTEAESVLRALQKKEILGGIGLGRGYPEMKNSLLVCATEMNTKQQMDQYIQALGVVL